MDLVQLRVPRRTGQGQPGSAPGRYLHLPEDIVVMTAGDESGGFLLRYPHEQPREINGDAVILLRLLARERRPRGEVVRALQRRDPTMSEADARAAIDAFVGQLERVLGAKWASEPAPEPAVFNRMTASRPLLRMYLELTQRCDLGCAHCLSARKRVERGAPELSTEEIFDLVDQAVELGCMEIDVSGGEARTRPDLVPILEHISKRGLYITLYTNGAAEDPTWVDALRGLRISSIVFSVDSVNPAVHDEFRRSKGALERTLASMSAAADAGFSLRVNTTMCEETEGSLGLTVGLMQHMRQIQTIVVAPVIPLGRARRRPELMSSARHYGDVMRELFGDGARASEVQGSATGPVCGVGDSLLFVSAKGEIGACPTLTGSEDPRFYYGNIRQRSLRDAWESYLGAHPDDAMRCRAHTTCPAWSRCGGGCRSRALVSFGDLEAPDYFSCAYFAPELLA